MPFAPGSLMGKTNLERQKHLAKDAQTQARGTSGGPLGIWLPAHRRSGGEQMDWGVRDEE